MILGASVTGLPIAHYLLKHTADKVEDLKVIVVAPNTDFYWPIASVRGILPDMLPDDKLFTPIAPSFAQYPAERYELVQGKAEHLDISKNIVEVRENDGSARKIQYDDLVIATGSSFKSGMPFKNLNSTKETKDALHDWAQRIKNAKSIVVAGAGTTGVEVAGELGEQYAAKGLKHITLVCDDELPLGTNIRRDVREAAKRALERLQVKVIANARVTSPANSSFPGTVTITNKSSNSTETLQADLLIPTYGIIPNTSFLPQSLLDSRGFVKQTQFLRAEGHNNIFVVGDAGNLESPQGVHADKQAVHASKLLEARLLGQEEQAYQPDERVMLAVTVGKNTGTGQVGGWKLWGWMVWLFKARYLGTDYAAGIAKGERTMTMKSW